MFPDKDCVSQVRWLLDNPKELSTTTWVTLDNIDGKTFAVVFAWNDGFDNIKSDNPYINGEYRICGKIAFNDSYMKEYDMDWLMPWFENGDVCDTEVSLESDRALTNTISFWEDEWKKIKEDLLNGKLKTENE